MSVVTSDGFLHCVAVGGCGRVMPMNPAYRNGSSPWPRCCEVTMIWRASRGDQRAYHWTRAIPERGMDLSDLVEQQQ